MWSDGVWSEEMGWINFWVPKVQIIDLTANLISLLSDVDGYKAVRIPTKYQ